MNRWVIGRTCLKTGPLATAWPHLRDVLRVAILAEARAIAIVRGEPTANVAADAADRRLAERLREAVTAVEIDWIDYLILSTRDDARHPEYRSVTESIDDSLIRESITTSSAT